MQDNMIYVDSSTSHSSRNVNSQESAGRKAELLQEKEELEALSKRLQCKLRKLKHTQKLLLRQQEVSKNLENELKSIAKRQGRKKKCNFEDKLTNAMNALKVQVKNIVN